jgi:uncharacterized protein
MSDPKKTVLITGASGLIGTRLTELLLQRGDSVIHLSRSKPDSTVPGFVWDIRNQKIDQDALHGVDTIVHLAGAGVADKRWTTARKREILESRTLSTKLLADELKRSKHSVRSFVCVSAIGYYGFNEDEILTEERPPGNDFLANVTRQWEQQADAVKASGVRVVKLRTGVVLSEKGGALKEMSMPVKFFAGAPLGSGQQFVSWIHIDDLCGIFMKAIDDFSMQGVYNAVAPQPVTNREMTKAIGKVLHKPVFLPPVPGFVLKLILGEMAEIVINGSKVSAEKIQRAGYTFRFIRVEDALKDLLGS